jgi:hypothetical protein
MKKIISSLLVAFALLSPSLAPAFVYHDEDFLLIFRKPGFDNVEFNLGTVSNYLNKANGYTIAVTNFDLSLVTNTLGSLSADVRFFLVASTDKSAANKRAWLGSSEPDTQPKDVTGSAWQNLWSQISGYGAGAQTYTASNATPSAVIPPGNLNSFDFIATGGGPNSLGLAKLNSQSTFTVEQSIPGTVKLWEIHPSLTIPKPNATLIGTFSLTSPGVLTFTADNGLAIAPPTITGVSRTNGVTSVTFTTVNGGTYQLLYSGTLTSPATNWPTVGATVPGDGTSHTLAHTNATASGFYKVVRSP